MSNDSQGVGCGGAIVLAIPVLGAAFALHAVAPEAFILVFWGGGWAAIIWAAKRTPKIDNPSPPPPPPPTETGNPQFSVVDDATQPGRSEVVWTRRKTGTP